MTWQLYQIDTGYFCAGVVVHEGRVTRAAPVLRWAVSRSWQDVERWARGKGARITACYPEAVRGTPHE